MSTATTPQSKKDESGAKAAAESISALSSALVTQPPVTSGTLSIPNEQCAIFYKTRDGEAKVFDFSRAPLLDDLKDLEAACYPATFGRNNEDVLDEAYRKAGKLDLGSFAMTLQLPELHTILERVKSVLAEGGAPGEADKEADDRDSGVQVIAELYKLNTYGVGGFFKAHQDMPHSERMFGSLVIVLPPAHEGGDLVIRHAGNSWSFGFGGDQLTSDGDRPTIGYVAFYSDVEHEVLPVTSGCRFTLTYNLLWTPEKPSNTSILDPLSQADSPPNNGHAQAAATRVDAKLDCLSTAFSALLANPFVLREGGTIGIHLQHKYPFLYGYRSYDFKSDVLSKLKGSDRALYRACTQHLYQSQIKIRLHYEVRRMGTFLSKSVLDFAGGSDYVETHELWDMLKECHAVALDVDEWERGAKNLAKMKGEVVWVNSTFDKAVMKEDYIAYGNEVQPSCAYFDAVFIIKVGKPGERELQPVEGSNRSPGGDESDSNSEEDD